jgi:hypothetical protein
MTNSASVHKFDTIDKMDNASNLAESGFAQIRDLAVSFLPHVNSVNPVELPGDEECYISMTENLPRTLRDNQQYRVNTLAGEKLLFQVPRHPQLWERSGAS